jgi:hypothetical protein
LTRSTPPAAGSAAEENAQAGYVLGIVGTILLVLGIIVIAIAVAVGGFAFTFNAGT